MVQDRVLQRKRPLLHTTGLLGFLLLGVPVSSEAQERRWLPLPIESTVIEDIAGSVLGGRPMQIEGSPRGGFVVTDWGEFSVREVSPSGELLWRSGRRGQGPGEFLMFLDLEFDPDGNLRVLDPRNRRITVLDQSGGLVGTAPLPGLGQPAALMPTTFDPGYQAVMWHTNKMDTLWSSFSGTQPRHRAAPMPPEIGTMIEHPLQGEGWAANNPDGGAVVYFRWSSTMILLNPDGDIMSLVDGVERIPFPETVHLERTVPDVGTIRGFKVDPAAVPAARSVTASTSRVFVLFQGMTAESGRLVDSYRLSDGLYLGTYLLPNRAEAIATLADGRLAALENNFVPTVRLLELQEADER